MIPFLFFCLYLLITLVNLSLLLLSHTVNSVTILTVSYRRLNQYWYLFIRLWHGFCCGEYFFQRRDPRSLFSLLHLGCSFICISPHPSLTLSQIFSPLSLPVSLSSLYRVFYSGWPLRLCSQSPSAIQSFYVHFECMLYDFDFAAFFFFGAFRSFDTPLTLSLPFYNRGYGVYTSRRSV